MAISRMQEPRQNYGLGSFVKKVTKKVTKPFTKVASKIVPKEIAGIMRAAAPFLPPGYREAAYLLGTAKQTGRISPMDLALTFAPQIGKIPTGGGYSLSDRIGSIKIPFTQRPGANEGVNKNLSNVLFGGKKTYKIGKNIDGFKDYEGIFGKGGDMYQIGKGTLPGTGSKQDFGIFDTKAGQKLFGTFDKEQGKYVPSLTKLGSIGIGLYDLIASSKTADEAGKTLVAETGNDDDYQRGVDLFSQLDVNSFGIPNQYLQQPAANGGLMRTNYAMGSDDEPKPLPNDPTEPVNPFRPKPIGPFPSKMADMKSYSDYYKNLDLEKALRTFRMLKERDPEDMEELIQFFKDRKINAEKGGLMRSNYALGEMAMNQAPSMGISPNLGSRPTEQESGLGGLPIEADMRYTGGFMPYGEVEKADDVPARLSKNEFVFTADAVRAAGGGSVQQGAKKMYDTMKKLEQQPEAKGAMA